MKLSGCMQMRRGSGPITLGLLAMIVLASASCRTATPPEPTDPPRGQREFRPATWVATAQFESGQYANLLGPDTYALWVGPQVTALKQSKAEELGDSIDEGLSGDVRTITANFIVIECHVESIFADMAIAYDLVGFRQADVYLEGPDGKKVRPLQTIIGTELEEEPRDALKRFARTNLVIFPRRDLWKDRPLVGQGLSEVRLVIEAHGSKFNFPWPEAPVYEMKYELQEWVPTEQEVRQAVKLGYRELYTSIRRLAHVFD
jgi:hypothetical protein